MVFSAVLLASMYASHTLIAYPIISRYGLSRLRSVNITIGGTAVTVTLALIILAVIGGMFKGTVDGWFWVFLVAKVAFLGFLIVFFFPRIGRWFFRKYDDSVMQFVFVLAMVFLGGGLMEFVGMEGILGAFLAGLVLNRLIPHVSPLMNRLEFVGNALFIPYFLIGVGMIIDVRSLFTGGEALKVAIVMTVVATFSKWLAAWITQKIYRISDQNQDLFLIYLFSFFFRLHIFIQSKTAGRTFSHQRTDDASEKYHHYRAVQYIIIQQTFSILHNDFMADQYCCQCSRSLRITQAKYHAPFIRLHPVYLLRNPETIEDLVNLALVIKDAKQKNALVALNVINDNNSSEKKEQQGKRNLEKAAMIAAAADVPVTMVSRYDLNIAWHPLSPKPD